MFGTIVQLLPLYRCACCDRQSATVYREGAFYCLECARGEHRHPGWGRKAA
jgi:hypothetical protein